MTELFQKVPDIDTFERFEGANDWEVVITVRGIGEMQPGNPDSYIILDPEADEFGVPRAKVFIADPRKPDPSKEGQKDLEIWDAMDRAAGDVARVLAGDQTPEVLGKVRDGLGTTHHEAGTLRMGEDRRTSVTDPQGRFHYVRNTYVAGPALFPALGSPNPMLTGIALARRPADILLPRPPATPPERGFESLFDGTEVGFNAWQLAGSGTFVLVEGVIIAQPAHLAKDERRDLHPKIAEELPIRGLHGSRRREHGGRWQPGCPLRLGSHHRRARRCGPRGGGGRGRSRAGDEAEETAAGDAVPGCYVRWLPAGHEAVSPPTAEPPDGRAPAASRESPCSLLQRPAGQPTGPTPKGPRLPLGPRGSRLLGASVPSAALLSGRGWVSAEPAGRN